MFRNAEAFLPIVVKCIVLTVYVTNIDKDWHLYKCYVSDFSYSSCDIRVSEPSFRRTRVPFQCKDGRSRFGNSHVKDDAVTRSSDLYMGCPILIRRHLDIETAPEGHTYHPFVVALIVYLFKCIFMHVCKCSNNTSRLSGVVICNTKMSYCLPKYYMILHLRHLCTNSIPSGIRQTVALQAKNNPVTMVPI